jgi:hypothetical protein
MSSDTLDANHLACYQALDAKRSHQFERTGREKCSFAVVEMWQQGVEMVRQSGGADKNYMALVDEEWQHQQYCDIYKKRSDRAAAEDRDECRLARVRKPSSVG